MRFFNRLRAMFSALEDGHDRDAQVVLGVAFAGQAAPQPHDGHAELRRQPGVGAGDLLQAGHIVSVTHYLG